jgi:short-subunit dehydrogenase
MTSSIQTSPARAHAGSEAAHAPTSEARGRAGKAIVVGASSGIGAALVRQLVGEGHAVAALARRVDLLQELEADCAKRGSGRLIVKAHDVLDIERVPALFEELVRELGGLDLYIYAAGVMPSVGPSEFDTVKDLEMLGVNVAGCIAWTNCVANLFRTQRSGTIVGISSIAGDRGRKGNPVYGTTKAAMNTYLEALRNRLGEGGVHVLTIKPGFVDTAMVQGVKKLFWLITPEQAASQILSAARGRAPRPNVRYVPRRWWLVGTIIRLIPSFIFRKLEI